MEKLTSWYYGDAYEDGELRSSVTFHNSEDLDEWVQEQRELGREIHTWWEWG